MQNIEHAFYINLESRLDRKIHVEYQLQNLGIKAQRFNAIKMSNGAIGCSMSHLKCLQIAKENNWDHLLIVEDDIEFTDLELFKKQLNTFLNNQKDWDVVLLAGNNMPPYTEVADYCVKVTRCQTTTGYMVKAHYFDTLIENIKTGIQKLIFNPENHASYAIDKYWFKLQEQDKWFLIVPLTVTQMQNYSDIENRITDYSSVMLDLNKKKFFMKQLEQIKMAKQQMVFLPNNIIKNQQIEDLKKMEEQLKDQMKFYDCIK